MPWTMNDYPSSFKNFDRAIRKKAIDIANSMLDEGYDEGQAIPIATEQAKEWFNNASEQEIKEFKQEGNPTDRSEEGKKYDARPELLDKEEHVVPHEDGWAVQVADAKQPSQVFKNKSDAIKRAKEIAENKGTEAVIYQKDGTIQDRHSCTTDR